MKQSQYWQNFELGKELEIACGFIYDGLRNLHEMENIYHESEIFRELSRTHTLQNPTLNPKSERTNLKTCRNFKI